MQAFSERINQQASLVESESRLTDSSPSYGGVKVLRKIKRASKPDSNKEIVFGNNSFENKSTMNLAGRQTRFASWQACDFCNEQLQGEQLENGSMDVAEQLASPEVVPERELLAASACACETDRRRRRAPT